LVKQIENHSTGSVIEWVATKGNQGPKYRLIVSAAVQTAEYCLHILLKNYYEHEQPYIGYLLKLLIINMYIIGNT